MIELRLRALPPILLSLALCLQSPLASIADELSAEAPSMDPNQVISVATPNDDNKNNNNNNNNSETTSASASSSAIASKSGSANSSLSKEP